VDEYKIVKKQITVTVPNTKPAATLENMLELTGHWIMDVKD
jgi:hypothetical protein